MTRPSPAVEYVMDNSTNRALVTGVTGQDGSYLAEFLVSKGYEVYALVRRTSTANLERIKHLQGKLHMLSADLLDQNSLQTAIGDSRPHEIYNLAAQSFVPASWEQPLLTSEVTALGVTRLLEAIRSVDDGIRFYQASTSAMFGRVTTSPQDDQTPLNPRTPYGACKAYAHYMTATYREHYGLYACAGILFNHESPRRGLEFVSRTITNGVARIKLGLSDELALGDLDARRDWGYAGDYVRAMWLMLQQEKPDDFVIATGIDRSIRDFCRIAFERVDLNWEEHVVVDEALKRPREEVVMRGDPSKASRVLGWEPQVDFEGLVHAMVDYDMEMLSR